MPAGLRPAAFAPSPCHAGMLATAPRAQPAHQPSRPAAPPSLRLPASAEGPPPRWPFEAEDGPGPAEKLKQTW